MTKTLRKVKKEKIWLTILLVVLTILILTTSTHAYFNFKKVYEGSGNLPKLNINYTVSGNNPNALKNISFTGQANNNITVTLNTLENNISGYVRVKVGIVWSNSLNNTPYNDNNDIVTACAINNTISENANLWQLNNGYYYLIQPMEKDTEVVLFDQIIFGESLSSYYGERVSLYIFAEIYQTTNLPENW